MDTCMGRPPIPSLVSPVVAPRPSSCSARARMGGSRTLERAIHEPAERLVPCGAVMTRPAVLLIDDEPGQSPTTRVVLIQGGYDVVIASETRGAFDLLSQRKFAAVVVDQHQP